MKDYISFVSNVDEFRTELSKNELLSNIDDNGYVYSLVPCSLVGRSGGSTVAICRMNESQFNEWTGLASSEILGEAKEKYIKSSSDVNWRDGGKDKYTSIWPSLIDSFDENGEPIKIQRPDILAVVLS